MNYKPGPMPAKDQLPSYLERELRRVADISRDEGPHVRFLSDQLTPTTWAANNFAPTGLATANVLRISASVTQTLTGIAYHLPDRLLTVVNVGTGVVAFSNADTNSSASNRFVFRHSAALLQLSANGTAFLYYDGISFRWRVLAHTGV